MIALVVAAVIVVSNVCATITPREPHSATSSKFCLTTERMVDNNGRLWAAFGGTAPRWMGRPAARRRHRPNGKRLRDKGRVTIEGMETAAVAAERWERRAGSVSCELPLPNGKYHSAARRRVGNYPVDGWREGESRRREPIRDPRILGPRLCDGPVRRRPRVVRINPLCDDPRTESEPRTTLGRGSCAR